MELALKMGCSSLECKSRVSSREFVRWKVYFENKWNENSKLDYQLAWIIQELRRSWVDKPSKVSTDFGFIQFTKSDPEIDPEELDEDEQQALQHERMMESKKAWFAILDLNQDELEENE